MSARRSGQGWIVFAGILLILSGVNQFLNGLWALNTSSQIEATFKDTLLFSDTNIETWGWIYLIVGAVVALAGLAIFWRMQWARWVGIIVATVGAIAAFFWLFTPDYWVAPIVTITLNLLVLYALVAYGDRAEDSDYA